MAIPDLALSAICRDRTQHSNVKFFLLGFGYGNRIAAHLELRTSLNRVDRRRVRVSRVCQDKEIKALNGLTSDTIYRGMKLKIPN